MDYDTHSREFNDAMHKLFHGKTTMERAAAANHLGYLKDRRATNSLARAIKKEKDPIVLNRIIEAMGELQDKKATMLIIEILKKELSVPEEQWDKQRVFLIIESLMKIGDKRALEDLGILLQSCDDDIRDLTAEAFECIDPNWRDNIKKN
ncbi:MAG: HEAT repeat domain-containing protein [Promethearchaeota archaeon]|nr:MAG: HEAT repeat domain-containing protein [Candidatus Lokiarchaeota archaeon]